MSVATASLHAATILEVVVFDRGGAVGQVHVHAPDAAGCALTWRGQPGEATTMCRVPAPVSALVATGTLVWRDDSAPWWAPWRRDRTTQGNVTWTVVDIGAVIAPLRQLARPFGDRVRDLVAAKEAFERTFASSLASRVTFELRTPSTAAAIERAERRLGFPLPPEHVHLLQTAPFQIDDSFVVPADALRPAVRAMVDDWGTPQASLDAGLRATTRELLEQSVILYTVAGDGYGALLYRPSGELRCGGMGAFYDIHQERLNAPRLLVTREGRCRDYTSAMIWRVLEPDEGGLGGYEVRDRRLLVDSSARVVRLKAWAAGPRFIDLVTDWAGAE